MLGGSASAWPSPSWAGFVLTSRQELRGLPGDAGMMFYSLNGLILWVAGAAAAAAVGRSFRSGLRACAWATVLDVPLLIAAWLAEALQWHQQGRGMLLDGEGGSGWAPTWAMRSVDPAVAAVVAPARGRARRGRRERACTPPAGPRARRSRLDDLNPHQPPTQLGTSGHLTVD